MQYPATCRACGKRLNVGELAFWIRYTYSDGSSKSFIYCPDCYYMSFDQSLAKKYLKLKEMEAVYKGLKKHADALAKELMELQVRVDVARLKAQVRDLLHAFHDAMINGEDQRIIEFLEKVDELLSKINVLEMKIKFMEESKKSKSSTRGSSRRGEVAEIVAE